MLQLVDVSGPAPTELLAAVLKARIEAALLRPRLAGLLRSEIPSRVFTELTDMMTRWILKDPAIA